MPAQKAGGSAGKGGEQAGSAPGMAIASGALQWHDLDLWPSLACRSVAEATSKAKDSGEWLGGGNRARLFFAEMKAEPCLAEPCKGQACAPERIHERRRMQALACKVKARQ